MPELQNEDQEAVELESSPLVLAAKKLMAERNPDETPDDTKTETPQETKPVEPNTQTPEETVSQEPDNDDDIPSLSELEKNAISSREQKPVETNNQNIDWVALAKDPNLFLDKMEELNISMDDIVNRALEPKKDTKENAGEEALKRLQQLEAEKEESEIQQAEDNYKQDIHDLVSDKEKFPLISTFNKEQDVFNLTVRHFNNSGEILEAERAAKIIEKELRTKFTTDKSLVTDSIAVLKAQIDVLSKFTDQTEEKREEQPEIKTQPVLTNKTKETPKVEEPVVNKEIKEVEPELIDVSDMSYEERLNYAVKMMSQADI